MDEKTITSLAREYAEEVVPRQKDMSQWLHNEYVKSFAGAAEEIIRFLLRRYALVEKEAVHKWTGVKLRLPEIDQRVLICERVANQYKIFIGRRIALSNGGWEWNQSTKESVVAWMPLPKYPHDLGKEVEG